MRANGAVWAVLLLVLQAGINAGCKSLDGENKGGRAPDEGPDPAPLPTLEQPIKLNRLWSTDIGGAVTGPQLLGLRPVLWSKNLYAVDGNGDLLAINAETGKRLWRRDSDAPVTAGPGVGDGLVVVGTDEGEVLAFSAVDGEPQWRTLVSSEVLAPPLVVSGSVVVRTLDGKLFSLSAESGRTLWVYADTVPTLTRHGTSPPVVYEGAVLAGLDSGKLIAIELSDGRPLWEITVASPSGSSELERMVDIDAELQLYEGDVVAIPLHGQLALINVITGRISWTHSISSFTEAAVDEVGVYLSDETGKITALDRKSGELLWEQDLLEHRHLAAPAVFAGYVLCGDDEGRLYWFDRDTGAWVGQVSLGNEIYGAPQVGSDRIFAYAKNGVISAFELK